MHSSLKMAFSLIGLLFLGLFIATYYTFKIAGNGHEGIVDKAYYEKGLNYEKEIKQKSELKKLGYRLDSKVLQKEESLYIGENTLNVNFNRDGQAVEKAKLSWTLERGATNRYNTSSTFTEKEKGNYTSQLNIPAGGQWILNIKAEVEGKEMVESLFFYADKKSLSQ